MNIIQRIGVAARAFRRGSASVDFDTVSKQLDMLIDSRQLETGDLPIIEKGLRDSPSQLDVRHTKANLGYYHLYSSLRLWTSRLNKDLDKILLEDPARDLILSEYWMREPILAGAIYSMCAKMTAMRWSVTGRRSQASKYAQIFAEAEHMGGADWGGFISSSANDFYTVNRGVFWETARNGNSDFGSLAALGHIDALSCALTGNRAVPVEYWSEATGQHIFFKPGEFIHFTSLPSPRERMLGSGFCLVDRAHRAAKLLMGLHDYDEEKLNNLPPEGVATVTGLTMDEFQDALALWQTARKRDNSLTFPQVLWLIGSQPNAEVKVGITGFSQLPESFDRKTVVDQYVNVLALCAGVDVREFWTMSSGSGLGSAGESEIQHMKAKGKGPGEFITTVERHVNGEVPESVHWGFDTQDIEEDANAAAVAKAWIDAFFPLYNLPPAGEKSAAGVTTQKPDNAAKPVSKANPQPDKPNGQPTLPTTPIPGVDTGEDMTNGGGQPNQPKQAEQVLDKEQFMRLLADKGVLPDWMLHDDRYVVTDTEIHINKEGHPDDPVKYIWDPRGGVLKEERLPAIIINTPAPDVPAAKIVEKGGLGSGNRGRAKPKYDYVDFDEIAGYKDMLQRLKQKESEIMEEHRNIQGNPIPEKEVVRGARITKKTLQEELERWRKHPILSKYALTAEEEVALLAGESKQ